MAFKIGDKVKSSIFPDNSRVSTVCGICKKTGKIRVDTGTHKFYLHPEFIKKI